MICPIFKSAHTFNPIHRVLLHFPSICLWHILNVHRKRLVRISLLVCLRLWALPQTKSNRVSPIIPLSLLG